MEPTPRPHDALFRKAFSRPENALTVLRAALPAPLLAAIDPGSLALESASFVDDALRDRHGDLLLRCRLAGREAFVYFLLEHQSTVDPVMPFRLLVYVVRVWESWLAEHPKARTLPPIVPLVVHQGPGGWTGPRTLREIVASPPGLASVLERHVPDFQVLFEEVGRRSVGELLALRGPPFARLVLTFLRAARSPEGVLGAIAAGAELLRALSREPGGPADLGVLLGYTLLVGRGPGEAIARELSRVAGAEVTDVMKTYAEQFIDQGRAEGLARGRAEGHAEGRAEGLALGLEALLAARFGPLTEATRARLARAKPAQLERWLARAATAPTLARALGRGK